MMSVEPEEHFDHIDDIFDRMASDARRRHVNAEALEVTTETGLEQARTIVNDAIKRGFVTAAELARRTGIKAAAISAFRNAKWKGKAGTLCTTASLLTKAIDQLQKQRLAEETSVDGFVSTRVAEAIYGIAHYAIKRRKMAAFVLPAGSGKTMALEQLTTNTPGAVLITLRARRSTPRSFLQLWARALGLQEWGRAEDIQERCIARLAGSDRLVLIDEVHKAPITTLDIIREVWDETRVPMVLAGTPSFYQTLTSRRVGDNASELMDQLYSRIGVFRDLSDVGNSASGDPGRLHTAEDKHRYVGELLTKVFGNLPDSEIDLRARGIMMGMLDRIASDVLHDGDLKPRDLRHVVQSYDVLRKGAIADAQEERRRAEWEVVRAAGVAEAARLIKAELADEIAGDPQLRDRLQSVVERIRARRDKPVQERVASQLLKSVSGKWGLNRDDMALISRIVGVNIRVDEGRLGVSAEGGAIQTTDAEGVLR